MHKFIRLIVPLLLLLIVFYVSENKIITLPKTPPTVTIAPSQPALSPVVLGDQTSHCQSIDGLPDRNCTPGVIDPVVTQDNIQTTICVRGYTTTVRPPVTYTNDLKKQQIIEYGFAGTNLHDYEEDHLISLELGGNPTDPKNLWPEPGTIPNPKDKIENLCHQKVCDGQIPLTQAQQEIATNWKTACQ